MNEQNANPLGDEFDQAKRRLTGRPDVVATRAATITVQSEFGIATQDWIVETYRVSDRDEDERIVKSRDVAFVRYMDANGAKRFVLPTEVLNTIARQRDALTAKNQVKAARASAKKRGRK